MLQTVKLTKLRQSERPIGAIKVLRDATGYMLRESKNIVDRLREVNPNSVLIEIRGDYNQVDWINFARFFDYELIPLGRTGPIPPGLPDPQHLAILLHDKLCRHNHVEGCSWDYVKLGEKDTWNDTPHLTYLVKANQMLVWVNFEIAKKIVETL